MSDERVRKEIIDAAAHIRALALDESVSVEDIVEAAQAAMTRIRRTRLPATLGDACREVMGTLTKEA